jgi:hypothetical protein
MTMTRSGITTYYRQARFRSRLEARWAAFFDLVDWSWTYEPLDANGWIPDFLVAGDAPFLVEVGPCILLSEFSSKAAKALAAFPPEHDGCELEDHEDCPPGAPPERVTLILGVGPLALPAGAGYLTDDGRGSGPDIAEWTYCGECLHLAVWHGSGDRLLRPCGHGVDTHYRELVTDKPLADLWSKAGNQVQWRPRRHAA